MDNFFCRECVAAEPLIKFLMWSAILLGGSLYCLYLARRTFKKARLIDDMPTSLIRSASQGFTELIGIATKGVDNALTGRLTATPCLWWRYSIEKYQRSGKSSRWVTIESGTSESPFHIKDSTGLCQVLPADGDITTCHKYCWYGSHQQPLTTPKREQRRSSSISLGINIARGIGIGRRYRYTEYHIKEGDPLYILGHFESDTSGQRTISVDTLAGNILRSWKQNFKQLLDTYDHDDDGQLDLSEWQEVQKAAARSAHLQIRTHKKQPIQHQISKPPESSLPFLIGSEGQSALSRRYHWQAVAYSAGFLVLGSGATWYLSARNLY